MENKNLQTANNLWPLPDSGEGDNSLVWEENSGPPLAEQEGHLVALTMRDN